MSTKIKRNMIWFSFFKISPSIFRKFVYHSRYWSCYDEFHDSDNTFIDEFSVIDFLSELTDFYGEEVKGSCLVIDNESIHYPIMLQAPNYEYKKNAKPYGEGPLADSHRYTSMCGVFLKLAEFLII